MKPLLRYPGGKTKIKELLFNKINSLYDLDTIDTYIEPFLGGGSMALYMMEKLPKNVSFYLSDIDSDLICLWKSVQQYPEHLIERVKSYTPTVESFINFKNELSGIYLFPNSTHETVDCGFKKLALHQISFSGLGTKAGSPIGGMEQKGEYKIDCRWNPKAIEKKIRAMNHLLNSRTVYFNHRTVENVLNVIVEGRYGNDERILLYLDPPYYVVGNQLYEHGMSVEEHNDLCNKLKNINCKWLLSYDNCEWVKENYSYATIENIDITYTLVNTGKNKEVIICPKQELL